MRITLSDHFTYQKLLRFTMPSIVMMIVTSVYSIVDGFFVSNCVGKNAFAALNLIFPVLMALSAFGFMVGTGGIALIAKTLGEGKTKEANGIFSMLVAILAVGGAVLGVLRHLPAELQGDLAETIQGLDTDSPLSTPEESLADLVACVAKIAEVTRGLTIKQ